MSGAEGANKCHWSAYQWRLLALVISCWREPVTSMHVRNVSPLSIIILIWKPILLWQVDRPC